MRIKRVLLATVLMLATWSWIALTSPPVARAQDDSIAADDGAVAGQDDVASDPNVVGPADFVGDWSGVIMDRRLGDGVIDVSIELTEPKHGKPKLKGTYEIDLAGRDRKGKTKPKVDSSGALKLNLRFGIFGRSCAVKATGMLVNPSEISGTYKAGGCRSSGTFDVTK